MDAAGGRPFSDWIPVSTGMTKEKDADQELDSRLRGNDTKNSSTSALRAYAQSERILFWLDSGFPRKLLLRFRTFHHPDGRAGMTNKET
jgi:hypothetical protein